MKKITQPWVQGSKSMQWHTALSVWAVIRPDMGMQLYLTEHEANRAKKHGERVQEFNVYQETDTNWNPLFPIDGYGQ